MKNGYIIGMILLVVFCATPGYAQIQWAGTHVVDLDANDLAVGNVSTWSNNAPTGGTFDVWTVPVEANNVNGPFTELEVTSSNPGSSGVPIQQVNFPSPNWYQDYAPMVWSLDAPASITGGSSFSVEVWHRLEKNDFAGVFSLGIHGDPREPGNAAWVSYRGGFPPVLYPTNTQDTVQLMADDGDVYIKTGRDNSAGGGIDPDEWVLQTLVYDGVANTLRTYINAVADIDSATTVTIDADCRVAVGAGQFNNYPWDDGFYAGFLGGISKVRVHDGALTPAEVLANFNEEMSDYLNVAAPVFTAEETTQTAAVAQSFTWTPALVMPALPTPDWTLDGEPVGMTIVLETGEISWDPVGAAGEYTFTVHVENIHGNDDLAVTLEVEDPVTPGVVDGDVISLNANFLGDGEVAEWVNFADDGGTVLPSNNEAIRSTFENPNGGQTGQVLFAEDPSRTPYYWTEQPLPADVTDGSWSMEVWAKPTVEFDGGWTTLIGIGNGQDSGGFAEITGRTNDEIHSFGLNTSSGNWYSEGAELDEWAHLAGTYDGTTVKFYINGEEVISEEPATALTIADGTHPTGSRFRISGRMWGQYGSPDSWNLYNGYLARVRLHSVVLTPAEVLGNYDAEKGEFNYVIPPTPPQPRFMEPL